MTDESESFDELSAAAQNKGADQAPSAVAAAAKRAQQAMESAKGLVAGANLDEIGARAAETASNLYRKLHLTTHTLFRNYQSRIFER